MGRQVPTPSPTPLLTQKLLQLQAWVHLPHESHARMPRAIPLQATPAASMPDPTPRGHLPIVPSASCVDTAGRFTMVCRQPYHRITAPPCLNGSMPPPCPPLPVCQVPAIGREMLYAAGYLGLFPIMRKSLETRYPVRGACGIARQGHSPKAI